VGKITNRVLSIALLCLSLFSVPDARGDGPLSITVGSGTAMPKIMSCNYIRQEVSNGRWIVAMVDHNISAIEQLTIEQCFGMSTYRFIEYLTDRDQLKVVANDVDLQSALDQPNVIYFGSKLGYKRKTSYF